MRVGVVDIGTNSMRLLITSDGRDEVRLSKVTGLGVGLDAAGELQPVPVENTLKALRKFASLMDDHRVERRAAIATSATRDAANREEFLDLAAEALGARPEVIDGSTEGRLAYAGATSTLPDGQYVVSDIGGGSTEFVTEDSVVSVDMGSVRLTDRLLQERPAPPGDVEEASDHVRSLFAPVAIGSGTLVGVAGTWTSLGSIDRARVGEPDVMAGGHEITSNRVADLVEHLAGLTLEQTRSIPGLDPARAPVILAGAVIARAVMTHLDVDRVRISERDTLDGRAAELADLP